MEARIGDVTATVSGQFGRFVDSFCEPSQSTNSFVGQLGSYTPCFTDVLLLGIAHVVAIAFCLMRLTALYKRRFDRPRAKMLGSYRWVQASAGVAAAACFIIVLWQLNGRIAAQAVLPLQSGRISPYEGAVYAASLVSWALFATVYFVEMNRYSTLSSWFTRLSIAFVTASQIAKLRLVLQLVGSRSYFFDLYIVYVALQLYLTGVALFHWPHGAYLQPLSDDAGYTPLTGPTDKICPEITAGFYDWMSFGWVSKLMILGYKRPLNFGDIWVLPPFDEVNVLSARFRKLWDRERATKTEPNLVLTLWLTTWKLFVIAIPYKVVNDLSQFVGPIFLSLLVNVVDSGGNYEGIAYTYACLMFIGLMIGTITDNQHYQLIMRAGYQMRAILTHEVFKKVLALTPSARNRFSSGFIFNLVTSDTEQLQLVCQNMSQIISSPIRIIVAMILLYIQLGPASLVVLAVIVSAIPLQARMVKTSSMALKQSLVYTDERSKVEAELLAGIEVVKCSTWESSFWDRIYYTRGKELGHLWHSFVIQSWNNFMLNSIPVAVAVLGFGVFIALGNDLSASQAFTSLTLFNLLRIPLFTLPQLITQLVNTLVGLARVETFLSAEEQEGIQILPPARPGETAVELNGDHTWDLGVEPALTQIDLKVPAGALVAIVGSTGSGKSSILASVLGLTQQVSGIPKVLRGSVAYVPQSAFLYNATVRDNIMFGGQTLEPDEQRYQEAIRLASLTRDLTLLPAGDLTELGDRGVNVSGGQKQRISIARAYYSNSDVYLFDDPLSALDAKVGRAVFNNCMAQGLKGTTRLLVTNQLQFVSAADWVVFTSKGRILEQGTYKDLMALGGGFAAMMAQAEHGDDEEEVDESSLPVDMPPALVGAKTAEAKKAGTKEEGRLVQKEGMESGALSLKIIIVYIMAMGGWLKFMNLLLSFSGMEGMRVATTVWLSVWTAGTNAENPVHSSLYYLLMYTLISGIQTFFLLTSQFIVKANTLNAAETLHENMLARLLKAPMSFFHTTPLGRTINRLTKDVSDVDKNLGDFASFFIRNLLQLVGTVLTIAVTTPFALPVIVPIVVLFGLLYIYFQSSVREVKRMDSVSRSPLYGTISEGINGVPTIRAYRAEKRLTIRNGELVDENVVMSHVNMSLNRWLSLRLESLGALAAFASALLSIEQKSNGSQLGLTVSYALTITQLVSLMVRNASTAENSFNAVERIDEYCHLPEEAAAEIEGSIPPHWPSKGRVEFKDVQMRYRPGLPLVLRGLSVTVEAGHKCGVVGRTGAGKSSLINSLFRLMELDGGSIVIDGVDIAKIGLKQLRANLSLIPQVPVLFTGTIRENLDPFSEHNELEIWTALRRSHLAPVVQASPLGLDMRLAEGGQPLSAGQKQLVALARALLRHSKVLVLDEATANVDVETDALIQKTVREEFRDNTIIAVAHRLHTVIDCDCVLVMDAGQAGEFGSPAELLSRHDGIFASMVNDTGEATAAFLRGVANGELSVDMHLQASMQRALDKAALVEVPAASPVHVHSAELLDRARTASEALQYCLEALREDRAAEPLREEVGLLSNAFDGIDTAAAQEQMQAALQVVADIYQLAEQARAYAARQQSKSA